MMTDPHDREPVDQATIDCWRINYGLDKRTPGDAARYWSDTCAGMAPAGAVAALGVALDELAALRKDAERYRTMLANLDTLVLRTEKGSTLTLKSAKRGEQFARRGTDATLDGLGAAMGTP